MSQPEVLRIMLRCTPCGLYRKFISHEESKCPRCGDDGRQLEVRPVKPRGAPVAVNVTLLSGAA